MTSAEATEKAAHLWARDPLDWYVEPESSTAHLLTVESFDGPIHDPCCGGGNAVRAALAAGYVATGSDLVERAPGSPWFVGLRDYLNSDNTYPNIIMNPPFFRAKGTEAFIRKALLTTERKVCAFVDRKFVTGAGRANGLYAEHPPTRIWEITPRPSCPPGAYLAAGHKAGGGTADWCWLVWDLQVPKAATSQTGWLRRAA